MNRAEWLEERKKGIGGSDSAVIMNLNNYKNIVQLWEEKTGRKEQEDISNKPCVAYGTMMESILRDSFRMKHPEFEVIHEENTIIKHLKYPFLFASLDGQLIDKQTGEKGILEIKTARISNSAQKENWIDRIPEHYFCQVLHYLNVTGYSFAYLFAELNFADKYQTLETYSITRTDPGIEESIKRLEKKEIEFWKNYVEEDIRPPLMLPKI